MHKLYKAIALIGLLLTILPPILVAMGRIDLALTKTLMFVGMIGWFLGATPWLAFSKLKPSDSEVEI
jgi:hypothetical protein